MREPLSVILERPGKLAVKRIPVPQVPGPSLEIEMMACGICGSDIRYFTGENPWAMHTLGENTPSPENMVLGHEVSGIVRETGKRIAVLAYRGCGKCRFCLSGRENICSDVQHIGHGAGWPEMDYYPGGMAEYFQVWKGFAFEIPESVTYEAATFLDGLAVAIHACDRAGIGKGSRAAVIGLGPIGMLAAQAAQAGGAVLLRGCDTSKVPVRLAAETGIKGVIQGDGHDLAEETGRKKQLFDAVIDTVGSADSLKHGTALLDRGGTLVLLAVHDGSLPVTGKGLSGERRIVSSANNPYSDFDRAIALMESGQIKTEPLVTHRFPLSSAEEAFQVMLDKDNRGAYKIILHP
ncbi:MAG: zinc-dependent alcohol dehydrogenase [Spirochaetia bacterium]